MVPIINLEKMNTGKCDKRLVRLLQFLEIGGLYLLIRKMNQSVLTQSVISNPLAVKPLTAFLPLFCCLQCMGFENLEVH